MQFKSFITLCRNISIIWYRQAHHNFSYYKSSNNPLFAGKAIFLLLTTLIFATSEYVAIGRSFRITQFPNGTVIGCAACHISPSGGGARTPFGQDVYNIIGGSSDPVPFWTPALAERDSDGDTYCNGQEVGDPDGDGVPIAGATVTNPGVSSSKPTNSIPRIISITSTQAVIGLPFQYKLNAIDSDSCQTLTFTKVSGPQWLTVTSNGLISGTPPEGSTNVVSITIRVSDNGSPAQSANQVITINLISSYDGWRQLKFNLPSENNISGYFDDPDNDGLINLLEYAFKLNPKSAEAGKRFLPSLTSKGELSISIDLRDDDPKLEALFEVSSNLLFNPVNSIPAVITNSTGNPGFKVWSFTDSQTATNTRERYGRLKLRLNQ